MNRSDIGLLLLVGLSGLDLTAEEEELLRRLSPAGIILFRKNVDLTPDVDWRSRFSSLCAAAKRASGRERFLISIDHEGGRVHRLTSPVTHFPAAKYWRDEVSSVTRAMAQELSSLGCNLSFFPVLDIHSEPTNPVIGERAFGTSPKEVSAAGLIALQEMRSCSVLSCVKHFPGHGATTSDSHFQLPVMPLALDELMTRELVPFRAAIDAGCPMVMTAHVVYPSLDSENPGTLSRRIVTGLLREQLGYSGVVITDDMEMKALNPSSVEERAVRALAAGVDLLLEGFPDGVPALVQADRMARAIRDALRTGALVASEIQASVQRMERLLERPELTDAGKFTESSIAESSAGGQLAQVKTPNFEQHARLAEKLRSV